MPWLLLFSCNEAAPPTGEQEGTYTGRETIAAYAEIICEQCVAIPAQADCLASERQIDAIEAVVDDLDDWHETVIDSGSDTTIGCLESCIDDDVGLHLACADARNWDWTGRWYDLFWHIVAEVDRTCDCFTK